jgi:(R)-amidase
LKIAVAQIACALGDPEANLSKAREFSPRAKDAGAELIVFPEMADTGYSMPVIQKHASLWKTGFVPGLCEVARELSIAIVSGVSERGGSSIYNSQILVDAKGDIVAKYRKTHLYAIEPVEEHTCFAQGDAFASFELGNLQLGFSICYDLPISGDVRESWPLSRKCMHLFSLPRGLFRESNISACSRKLERSKPKLRHCL